MDYKYLRLMGEIEKLRYMYESQNRVIPNIMIIGDDVNDVLCKEMNVESAHMGQMMGMNIIHTVGSTGCALGYMVAIS